LANFQGYPNGPQIGANQLAQDLGRGAVYGFIAYTKGRSIAEGGEYEAPELAGMVLYYYPCYSWVGEVRRNLDAKIFKFYNHNDQEIKIFFNIYFLHESLFIGYF
jgi:hypothetical protein